MGGESVLKNLSGPFGPFLFQGTTMERIVITVDDDDEIDITAKSEGGDVETMTAPDMESAVSIVRDLLMDATEDSDMSDMDEDMDMEASMGEDMPDMDEV